LIFDVYAPLSIAAVVSVSLVGLSWAMEPSELSPSWNLIGIVWYCNRHRSPRDRTGWAAPHRALGRVMRRPGPSRRQAPSLSLYGASSLAFVRGVRVRC
jgi:hypothetical protein